MSATPRPINGGASPAASAERSSSAVCSAAILLTSPVDRIGHKPVALRLAHRPARQHPAQPLLVGVDPPPRRPGVPADEGEVARLLAQGLVGRGPEAFDGLVALLAGVPLDAGPVAFDEVELGVVLEEEDSEVAPRDDELLNGVLLELEVRLNRQEGFVAARHAVRHALVLRDVSALVLADALLRLGSRAGLLLL